jgi:hypothetical protein
MHIFVKLLYFIIFCSFDVLLYLRLGKNIVKANYWLIATAIIWLIMLILHLPEFSLAYLMPLKDFAVFSGMVIQLLIAYYVGAFAIRRMERSLILDDLKQNVINVLTFIFKKAIFAFFLLIHLLFILSWPG